MADSDSDNNLSEDEIIDNVGEFDLVNVNNAKRIELERQWQAIVGDSDEEDEFEGWTAADIYVDKTFDQWRKVENPRVLHNFNERVGPVRNFDTSASALNFFQLFYSDDVFENIVNFTNLNANRKRGADPNHKGKWTDVTVPEIKAFYGILILMDIMKFDREELYWMDSQEFRFVGSKIGEIMPISDCVTCTGVYR